MKLLKIIVTVTIVIVLILGFNFIYLENPEYILKNFLIWFFIVILINLFNLLFTLYFFDSDKFKQVGKKGAQGKTGVKGYRGGNIHDGELSVTDTKKGNIVVNTLTKILKNTDIEDDHLKKSENIKNYENIEDIFNCNTTGDLDGNKYECDKKRLNNIKGHKFLNSYTLQKSYLCKDKEDHIQKMIDELNALKQIE